MKFGKIFCYLGRINSGQSVTWKVLAETRAEADNKVATYLNECNGYYDVPNSINFVRVEDDLILY